MTLRAWLAAVAAVAAIAALCGAAGPAAASPGILPAPQLIDLPAPTGEHSVGTQTVFLADPARGGRPVHVKAWYPTNALSGQHAMYLSENPVNDAAIAAALTAGLEGSASHGSSMFPRIHNKAAHSLLNAPVDTSMGKLPVILFAPAFGTPAYVYAGFAEDLASHGYIVVAMSITGEAIVNEVPGGLSFQSMGTTQPTFNHRLADYQFVLDQLGNLPGGVGKQVDLGRIGGGGHSWGSAASMEAAYGEPRIKAVASLDGTPGPGYLASSLETNRAMNYGLTQPVLRLQGGGTLSDPNKYQAKTWSMFQANAKGPLEEHIIPLAGHYYFADTCYTGAPAKLYDPMFCGWMEPEKIMETMATIRNFLLAFYNQHLKGW